MWPPLTGGTTGQADGAQFARASRDGLHRTVKRLGLEASPPRPARRDQNERRLNGDYSPARSLRAHCGILTRGATTLFECLQPHDSAMKLVGQRPTNVAAKPRSPPARAYCWQTRVTCCGALACASDGDGRWVIRMKQDRQKVGDEGLEPPTSTV